MINTLQLAQWGLTLAIETGQPPSVIQAHQRRVDHFTRALKPSNERPSATKHCDNVAQSVTKCLRNSSGMSSL